MLNVKSDINQQDFKIVDLNCVKSEFSALTWSCESRQRDTTSSGKKFKLNNVLVQGIISEYVCSNPQLSATRIVYTQYMFNEAFSINF